MSELTAWARLVANENLHRQEQGQKATNLESPCGRCNREAYFIQVGEKRADVDELRSFSSAGPLLSRLALQLRPPPSPEEYEWLAALAEAICDGGRKAFTDRTPAPVAPRPPSWYTKRIAALRHWFAAQFA